MAIPRRKCLLLNLFNSCHTLGGWGAFAKAKRPRHRVEEFIQSIGVQGSRGLDENSRDAFVELATLRESPHMATPATGNFCDGGGC